MLRPASCSPSWSEISPRSRATIERGGWLYVAESTWPGVTRLPLAGGEPEPVLALEGAIPDGLAFDAEGGLWISCWQPNRILRLAPDGELETIADDWSGIHVLTPNNVAFVQMLPEVAFPALAGDFVRAFPACVQGQPLAYREAVRRASGRPARPGAPL